MLFRYVAGVLLLSVVLLHVAVAAPAKAAGMRFRVVGIPKSLQDEGVSEEFLTDLFEQQLASYKMAKTKDQGSPYLSLSFKALPIKLAGQKDALGTVISASITCYELGIFDRQADKKIFATSYHKDALLMTTTGSLKQSVETGVKELIGQGMNFYLSGVIAP